MTNIITIVGASGHGKVVAEVAELQGYQVVFFDDNYPEKKRVEHWPVLGNFDDLVNSAIEYENAFIAIGNNLIRGEKQQLLQLKGFNFPTLVHPQSIISKYAEIGAGTIIMASAIVNAYAKIGSGVIINTAAIVEHDCSVHDYAHISPNATLAGQVEVGEYSWVGASSVVKQQISIEKHCVIGAGSVVLKNVPERSTSVGVPAQVIKGKSC